MRNLLQALAFLRSRIAKEFSPNARFGIIFVQGLFVWICPSNFAVILLCLACVLRGQEARCLLKITSSDPIVDKIPATLPETGNLDEDLEKDFASARENLAVLLPR